MNSAIRSLCLLFFGTLPCPATAGLQLTAPLDYQVIQRATSAGGPIVIAGEMSEVFSTGDVLEARLLGPDLADDWTRVVTPLPDQRGFQGELVVPAGGWFVLEVRAKRHDEILGEARVGHVGMGEVFVVAGQSNSANHGEEKQTVRSGLVASFSGAEWRIADDPQPGASGDGGSFIPPFADLLARTFNVPIGILATGAGGTSVREWLPREARFQNPPTITAHVTPTPDGQWASDGWLFDQLVARMRSSGPGGFRALLWHQGESDANQSDATRTLSGELYQQYLTRLIRETRQAVGWEVPWFVAQASYHTPEDPGSADIRAAQAAVWETGLALAGPDTDALNGEWRDGDGKGVHFNGRGLREHGKRWADKVMPWLEQELAGGTSARPFVVGPTPRIVLPGTENFVVAGRPAFVFLPPVAKRASPQPWILYAPTLPGYPDGAERGMHERFLEAGIAVAGVDVGEAHGSPRSHPALDALWEELVGARGFAGRPCLFGRSRGGLWVSSWAIARPERVAGIIGIYPVFDLRSYPGLQNAAPAYALTPAELDLRLDELNPIARIGALAEAGIPAMLIHGDRDTVVPLPENSGEFAHRYRQTGAGSLVNLIVLPEQGHSFHSGYFQSMALVDFAIARARIGAGLSPSATE